MNKGKFGIVLSFYAILAFVLALLGQTLLCGLLLGFVIAVEKDEWASKQVMQAFFLSLFSTTVSSVFSEIKLSLTNTLYNVSVTVPFVGSAVNGLIGVITGIVSILVLVFAIIGIVNVCGNKDAGVPLLSILANKAYGMVPHTVYSNPTNPQGPQNPTNGGNPQGPQNPTNGGNPQGPQNPTNGGNQQ